MDDYVWEMKQALVRRNPDKVPRRKAVGRVLVRFVPVLIGVLLITTVYQYVMWVQGPENVSELMHFLGFPNKESALKGEERLWEQLGLNDPFMPDFWPFDNESLWRSEQTEYRFR